MKYFLRNFHILLFAMVSIASGVLVASNAGSSKNFVKPVVEDAVELQEMAVTAYKLVASIKPERAVHQAVAMYVATLRMPSMLFENLAVSLEGVEQQLDAKAVRRGRQTPKETMSLSDALDVLKRL